MMYLILLLGIIIWFIISIYQFNSTGKKPSDFIRETNPVYPQIKIEKKSEMFINETLPYKSVIDNNIIKKNIVFTNDFMRDITLSIAYYDNGWKSIGWYIIKPKNIFVFNFPENYRENNVYIYAVSSHKKNKKWTGSNYFKVNRVDAFNYSFSGYKNSNLIHKTPGLGINESLFGFMKLNIFNEYNNFNFCEENKDKSVYSYSRGDILTNYRGDYNEWVNRMDSLNINGLLSKSQKKRYRKKKNYYRKKRGY